MVFFLGDLFLNAVRPSGRSAFLSDRAIRSAIRLSKNFVLHDGSPTDDAGVLLIFQAARQQTWLVATPKRIYCILDDLRVEHPKVLWSERLSKHLDASGALTHPIVVTRHNERNGRIALGPDAPKWLYSRKLFTVYGIDEQVHRLLKSQLVDAT